MSETIVAQATPFGESAIAMVRMSGADLKPLAAELLGRPPLPRRTARGAYRDRSGVVLDDVLFCYFSGPASYTGEDVLEISTHGNPLIVRKVLDDLMGRGCRLAEPGEFTKRAFLNGRMDLSQAEAVMDLIHARSDRALEAANRQIRGVLGRKIQDLIDRLLQALAELEAYIDFPEEDLPPEDQGGPASAVRELVTEIGKLSVTQRYGALLREGVGTVILGAPNAGKSSLLNRLAGRDRAIVSEQPGTTRDFLEEKISMGRHCIRLIDTAGIHDSTDSLEKMGMEKTLSLLAEADLFLLVVDSGVPFPALPEVLVSRLNAENSILVYNKADLLDRPPEESPLPAVPHVVLSALTGQGMENLAAALETLAERDRPTEHEDWIAVSARHAHALENARSALTTALDQFRLVEPAELVASELRSALDSLGEITGKVDNEAMLDKLFASFCIGK
ncbi:MAG: tRNA uridine-5-carboxymethylaminomethyl(34) synthesis GTPase MnmE [Opitutales bacterium]